ncbi:MAG: SDR family NAD(P)-dependent oxidoreductase [Bacteroidetes bacterium]|jgi:NADP-dependent 3-hydroxy acid dehydrogenase YdfG|nr:SDR family NAD(P)-dependent oxidoreductase [Bacteroidota bacterium]
MNVENKVCVITGVSKGIGHALVQGLLEKGAIVVGFGRTKPEVANSNFHFFEADVRSFDSVNAAYNKMFDAIGKQVDVLINNAGLGYFAYLEDHTIEQWHEMMETNVNGIFYMCKIATPIMKSKGSGHIINIASTAGIEGYPQVSGYCATKFAVKGMSQSMYKEMRDFGIKVTCIYPGSVKTDFFRNSAIETHDYMLMPQDVADMIIYSILTPDNFHQVNVEVRPLQPKGPKK